MSVNFIYESLKEHDKQIIDKVIEEAVKAMILNIGFNYDESDLLQVVNELALRDDEIEFLLGGNTPPNFNSKVSVIRCKAFNVAHGITQSKPSLEQLEHLVRLLMMLQKEPTIEMFFNKSMVEKLINEYSYVCKKDTKFLQKVVDLNHAIAYTKSSNTIWFVRKMYEIFGN